MSEVVGRVYMSYELKGLNQGIKIKTSGLQKNRFIVLCKFYNVLKDFWPIINS